MKYYRYLLLATLFSAANALALQPKVEIVEQFDNLRMVAFISVNDITDSPEWNPDSEPPPVTVSEAIQAVKAFDKNLKGPAAISEIEIRPVPRHEKHWHYLVKVANDTMQTKFDIYVVLMSGKVIPAMIEPKAYK